MTRRRHLLLIIGLPVLIAMLAFAWVCYVSERDGESTPPSVRLSQRLASLTLVEMDGQMMVATQRDGRAHLIAADDFLRDIRSRQRHERGSSTLFAFLDITHWTGLLWVGIGFAGQAAFTGRMIVQWLVSEKQRRSVIPVAFWWMSLIGASMLIVYFTWRIDVVGVLGQSTGWVIYIRNLWMIYRPGPATQAVRLTDDPAPEPELPA